MDNDEPLLLFSTSAEHFDTFPIKKLPTLSFMFPLKPPFGLAYVSTVTLFLASCPYPPSSPPRRWFPLPRRDSPGVGGGGRKSRESRRGRGWEEKPAVARCGRVVPAAGPSDPQVATAAPAAAPGGLSSDSQTLLSRAPALEDGLMTRKTGEGT